MTDHLTTALRELTDAVAALNRAAMTVEAELVAVAPDPDDALTSRLVDRLAHLAPIVEAVRIATVIRTDYVEAVRA